MGKGIASSVAVPKYRNFATAIEMATPYKIHVKPGETGLLQFDQDEHTATLISRLLQKDLEVRDTAHDRGDIRRSRVLTIM